MVHPLMQYAQDHAKQPRQRRGRDVQFVCHRHFQNPRSLHYMDDDIAGRGQGENDGVESLFLVEDTIFFLTLMIP